VPRDASATRLRLLDEAARVFATRGVYQSTVKEILAAAGQRNASALTYHFGSREGVLRAILRRHGDRLDAERGALIDGPVARQSTRDLVGALVVPLGGLLGGADGRNYLRILAQLTERFPAWHVDDPLTPTHLRRILRELEARAGGRSVAIRRERIVNAIMLLTASMAERARVIDTGTPPALDQVTFLSNLADMIIGGLDAPSGPPLAAFVAAAS
jgi:AcrR family transcriptional regulator